MSKYLDTMRNKTADIQTVAFVLDTLSESFYTTGNTTLGEKLSYLAETLHGAYEEINTAVSKELTNQARDSQQSAYNTVAACLVTTILQNERL